MAIKKRGTKPRWFMRGTVPMVVVEFDDELKKALGESVTG